MIVVIIAGGSGTRLWPLSTPDYPKHLLSLTNDKSLLQNTYERVRGLTSVDKILIVSEASHADHVISQLPDAPRENIIIEPGRRGTASCFLLAMRAIRDHDFEDQAVFFHWADHVIRDQTGFCSTAMLAGELAEKKQKMVFVGIEPTFPSTGLGYMEKGERLENGYKTAYQLARFVEKPEHKTAVEYFDSGNYLWNTGYLMTTISTLEREIQEQNRSYGPVTRSCLKVMMSTRHTWLLRIRLLNTNCPRRFVTHWSCHVPLTGSTSVRSATCTKRTVRTSRGTTFAAQRYIKMKSRTHI